MCLLQLLKSRLILAGIANSLDLTERLLPGLEARVLQERLQALPGPVFAAKAIEFCARKVSLPACVSMQSLIMVLPKISQ